jgi:hypothetical protein
MRTKVLVIFSWDDDISKFRRERMQQDRRLESYDVIQGFALTSPSAQPEANELYKSISNAIDSANADVLLIHTGAAYLASPQAFADTLIRIRKAYPTLRLGFQRPVAHLRHLERRGHNKYLEELILKSEALERLGVFEQSDAMMVIERDFFG